MTPQATLVRLAEKHGAIACFSREGVVTLTLTCNELKELVKSAIAHSKCAHKEQEHVQSTTRVHRCV